MNAQSKPGIFTREPRSRYLPQSYLFETARDLRRKAARLMKDADGVAEQQARVLREEAVELVRSAKRFDEQADVAPSGETEDLPFA
jgi:hypothetical protein